MNRFEKMEKLVDSLIEPNFSYELSGKLSDDEVEFIAFSHKMGIKDYALNKVLGT